jgi:glycosyltransferase involved in cell wall biosynthesis
MIKAGFVMEQHLGHRSYYLNLHRFISKSTLFRSTWFEVTYSLENTWLDKIPLLPKHLSGTLVGLSQVRRSLAQDNFDVLVFNTQVPAALAGEKLYKKPYIICTDITPMQYDRMGFNYGHRPDIPGPIERLKFSINQHVFQNAARILPWSNWTRNSLVEDYGISPEKIEVIPPGVDINMWRPECNANDNRVRILFVGTNFYRKGGDLLVEACRTLPAGTFELILVTTSKVPQEPWITTYNNLKPNSEELIQLYNCSDIFVLPTKGEAFGIAAVEACSAGLPVIATNIGGLPDIIVDNENGFLISIGAKEELCNRLHRLIDDPHLRFKMGEAGRVRAEKYFNAQKNTDRIMDIILEIAER